jgi:hypothetical protein
MTKDQHYEKYYSERMSCLKKILRITEEFLGSVSDWESYENHLQKRELLIERLKQLDEAYGKDALSHCKDGDRAEMNNILNLILALDDDIASAIDEERIATLNSIKANIKELKITGYGYGSPPRQGGKLLDRKE